MTRTLFRLGTLIAGIATPLCVLAITASAPVEEMSPTLATASTAELDEVLASARAVETITVLDQFGEPRQIPAELLMQDAGQDQQSMKCCWVWYSGFWWCIPCQ
jgi:hypothetical protein